MLVASVNPKLAPSQFWAVLETLDDARGNDASKRSASKLQRVESGDLLNLSMEPGENKFSKSSLSHENKVFH